MFHIVGFPGGSVVENPPANGGRCDFNPWVGKIPWRREWQPTPVFLLGESHKQRSLVGCSPRGHKELDTTEQLSNNSSVRYGSAFMFSWSLLNNAHTHRFEMAYLTPPAQMMMLGNIFLMFCSSVFSVYSWASIILFRLLYLQELFVSTDVTHTHTRYFSFSCCLISDKLCIHVSIFLKIPCDFEILV